MSQATPLQTMLSDVKTVLSAISDVTIYDYWPPIAAKMPCISLFPISGRQEEVGIGQQMAATVKGSNIIYHLQIDIWGKTADKVKSLADQVKYKLWENRGSFGTDDKDIRMLMERWIIEVLRMRGREEEEFYRVSQTWETAYAMTKV